MKRIRRRPGCLGDKGTGGQRDMGTEGHGDMGTWGQRDKGTRIMPLIFSARILLNLLTC